jgi:hypothetical protein
MTSVSKRFLNIALGPTPHGMWAIHVNVWISYSPVLAEVINPHFPTSYAPFIHEASDDERRMFFLFIAEACK